MENDLQQLNNDVETADGGDTATTSAPKNKKFSRFVDILLWVLIAILAVALVMRAFVYTQITVSGASMMETFHDKEVVGVSKIKAPKRGDVIVFYKQDGANKFFDIFSSGKSGDDNEHTKLIKRLVAISGDKLWVEQVEGNDDLYYVVIQTADGTLLYEDSYVRNGETLNKESFYIQRAVSNGSGLGNLVSHIGRENALEIADGYFFAMGDNRVNSSDSRAFGVVPTSRLYGVVINA